MAEDYVRATTEPGGHTLALPRCMDAKLDLLQSDVTDLQGRLEGRLTSVDVRLDVLETFDSEMTRVDRRLEHGRRLARIEDVTILAEPPAE